MSNAFFSHCRLDMRDAERNIVSRNRNRTALGPFWEFAVLSGRTVKSVLAIAWLSPIPTMALPEMPIDESRGPTGA